MFLKILRFVSIVCAALVLGLTVTHDLEIPAKRLLDGASWLNMQHTFYGGFAIVGGISEILGLLSTSASLILLRRHRVAFVLTLISVICFVGMIALFALGNNPLNQQIATWTPATLPANWPQVRDAWDSFHAFSSVFAAVALTVLLIVTVWDMPSSGSQKKQATERTAAEVF